MNQSGFSQSVPRWENSLLESKKRTSLPVHTKPYQRANKSLMRPQKKARRRGVKGSSIGRGTKMLESYSGPGIVRLVRPQVRQEKGFYHSDITDVPSHLHTGWSFKVINAPSSAHQSSLPSLSGNEEAYRPQRVFSSVTTPIASTTMVTATKRHTIYSSSPLQDSTSTDGIMVSCLLWLIYCMYIVIHYIVDAKIKGISQFSNLKGY